MNRFLKLATTLVVCSTALPVLAQQATDPAAMPGQDFLAQWDLDGDGQVTLAEARSHRADIFTMFDSDNNGSFSAEELAGIDDFKKAQLEAGMGPGHQRPEGMGRGMGQGRMGQGFLASAEDQMRAFDGNGDGQVTQAEFVAGTERWFARRDRTGDGVVTVADFGPRRRS